MALINPEAIVDSAGLWDSISFVNWFYDTFNDLNGILTDDGGIVFNPNIRLGKATT